MRLMMKVSKDWTLDCRLDLKHCNTNNWVLDKIPEDRRPEVVLVKKVYDRARRHRRRRWKLARLDGEKMETGSTTDGGEFNEFLEDLEEDPTSRQYVNIYRKPEAGSVAPSEADDGDLPQISLAEMLQDLVIEDDPMGDADA